MFFSLLGDLNGLFGEDLLGLNRLFGEQILGLGNFLGTKQTQLKRRENEHDPRFKTERKSRINIPWIDPWGSASPADTDPHSFPPGLLLSSTFFIYLFFFWFFEIWNDNWFRGERWRFRLRMKGKQWPLCVWCVYYRRSRLLLNPTHGQRFNVYLFSGLFIHCVSWLARGQPFNCFFFFVWIDQ